MVVFYATIDVDSVRPYIPAVPVLLPASSFARKGLKPPALPEHVTERAVDCGGFVATLRWGDYRYTPDEYVAWCRSVRPSWAATMDYCCEPEVLGAEGLVLHRQDRTTEMAWRFWVGYRDEPWAWVPTVQGWAVDDYRRHARDLAPLVRAMSAHYGGSAFRVGVGTLCRRASVGMIRDVVCAVREELPGIGLHLWGVKLGLFRSAGGVPPGVVSVDSAAWSGPMGKRNRDDYEASGLTQRRWNYERSLPAYRDKIAAALAGTIQRPLFASLGGAS